MADIARARSALVARILDGDGRASSRERRAAFDNAGLEEPLASLVDQIATHATDISDEDIARARQAGFTEDQLFELAICAAVGQATRQYEAALAALEAAERRG